MIGWGIILCTVEAWSVKEKAEKKARKRMDEAAAALAKVLDKETVLELLRAQMKDRDSVLEEKKEHKAKGSKAATRTILNKDDN